MSELIERPVVTTGELERVERGELVRDEFTNREFRAMAIELIAARKQAAEITRLNEALAAKDALIRELVGAVSDAKSVLSNCSVEAGYCCCGDSIESHGIYSGHSPVDMGAYSAEKAVDKATAALTRAKEMGYE